MRVGHLEAQEMFLQIGSRLGFSTRRTYNESLPTDGVWLIRNSLERLSDLPFAAVEVPISESPKTIRGSVAVLEAVSPLVAVVVLNEDEIRRGFIRQGRAVESVDVELMRVRRLLVEATSRSKQRFQIWSMEELSGFYKRVVGRRSIHRPNDLGLSTVRSFK